MKNVILGICLLTLLFGSACKKSTSSTAIGPGGSWTFKSTTYNAYSAILFQDSFNAVTQSPSSYLTVNFSPSASLAPGGYQVLNYSNSLFGGGNIVSIEFVSSNGNTYRSTGSGSQSIQVNSLNAKMSISGSGITLLNINNPSDSATLSINVTETI